MTQTILISGGGRGAGLGIATTLAGDGHNIVVADLDPNTAEAAAESVRLSGAESLAIAADVSDEGQVDEMFRRTVERFGTVDVLINCVAWLDPAGPIVDLPTERWHKAIRTNLDSVMFTTRAALRLMYPQKSGVIVNFSSVSGTRGFPDRASYGATKAAIINFTQTTAMEGREHGVRANCLVPGGIEGERTRALREMVARRAREGGPVASEEVDYPGPPIQYLTPEWIGRYVRFLMSEDGSMINGQAIPIGESARSPLQSIFFDL